MKNEQCIILNTDAVNKKGTHWCSLVKRKNKFYFYDSYNRNHKNLSYYWKNKNWFQPDHGKAEESVNGADCGQISLAFLICFFEFGVKTYKYI